MVISPCIHFVLNNITSFLSMVEKNKTKQKQKNSTIVTRKIAQKIRTLAALPETLGSISNIHKKAGISGGVLTLTEGAYYSHQPRTSARLLGPALGESLSTLYSGSGVSVGEHSQALNFREEEDTSVSSLCSHPHLD